MLYTAFAKASGLLGHCLLASGHCPVPNMQLTLLYFSTYLYLLLSIACPGSWWHLFVFVCLYSVFLHFLFIHVFFCILYFCLSLYSCVLYFIVVYFTSQNFIANCTARKPAVFVFLCCVFHQLFHQLFHQSELFVFHQSELYSKLQCLAAAGSDQPGNHSFLPLIRCHQILQYFYTQYFNVEILIYFNVEILICCHKILQYFYTTRAVSSCKQQFLQYSIEQPVPNPFPCTMVQDGAGTRRFCVRTGWLRPFKWLPRPVSGPRAFVYVLLLDFLF